MTTSEQATVIGIFRDRTLAAQAIDELRQAGWSNEQVHLLGQQTGGLLSSLKNTFSASSASDELTLDDPLFQGLTDEQRAQCHHALEQGNSIIAVSADTRPLEVRDTLHRFGAMNVILPSTQGQERIISLRREDVTTQKNTVVVGELRIHKRVITENKTFTIPVTREEVTIERYPFTADPTQQPAQTSAASASTQPAPLGDAVPPYQQLNTQPTDMAAMHEMLENGGSFKILVHEEQVMIQKQSVIIEEIHIHKQIVEETRNLSVPVRHEEAFFERHGNFPVHSDLPEGSTVATGTSIPSE